MKWHKFSKCLPPQGKVVLVHVSDFEYMVGTLVAIGEDKLDEFAIMPYEDGPGCTKVKDCIAWTRFKNRSPYEGNYK